LWKAKQPYNVNVAASTAVLASLGDLDTLANNVDQLRKDRDQMRENLGDIPFLDSYPSQGNFVLCKVNGRPAGEIKEALMKRGILVRHYNNPLLEDYIRISVGLPKDITRLLAALEEMI
jgi:histidinol-phosphate aminotransferase